VGDSDPVAVGVVAIAHSPGDAAHVAAARDEPAEPVVSVGDALARQAVDPGLGLKTASWKH